MCFEYGRLNSIKVFYEDIGYNYGDHLVRFLVTNIGGRKQRNQDRFGARHYDAQGWLRCEPAQ